MSNDASQRAAERPTAALFNDGELPIPAPGERPSAPGAGSPRLMWAQRDQTELRPCDLDSALGP